LYIKKSHSLDFFPTLDMISIFNQTMIHTSLHKRQQKSLLLAREQKDAHMLCYTPKNQDYEKKPIIFVMFP